MLQRLSHTRDGHRHGSVPFLSQLCQRVDPDRAYGPANWSRPTAPTLPHGRLRRPIGPAPHRPHAIAYLRDEFVAGATNGEKMRRVAGVVLEASSKA